MLNTKNLTKDVNTKTPKTKKQAIHRENKQSPEAPPKKNAQTRSKTRK